MSRHECLETRRVGPAGLRIGRRRLELVVEVLCTGDRENGNAVHCHAPGLAVAQREAQRHAAHLSLAVGNKGLADGDGKTAYHWHPAPLKHNRLR